MAMNVELVSPERILYSGDAEMVTCRTVGGGDIAFLAEHAPFLGALEIGKVKVKTSEGEDVQAAVHGGFVHVRDNQVIILSDVAELADDIDADRARKAKEAAERRDADIDDAAAEAAIARANIRLEVAGK
ncbi:MAG TPA: ATP synthase F1 subunit epsilon [Acidimicrobiales bacterium]|nr:ATP synthase F1 subunit epsilon [Acidimicrobiales bacterium]